MMSRLRLLRVGGLLALALAGLGTGCDVPTEAPSIDTQTEIGAPLLADKTFSFLGGPASEHTPLLDTTRQALDSLLSVGTGDRTVFVEQEVSNFGLGTIDGVLDAGTRGIAIDTSVGGPLATDDPIVTQPVRAAAGRRNGVFESAPQEASIPLPSPSDENTVEATFPVDALLEAPATPVVDAREATVESVRLTGATSTNRVAFTLTNGRSQGTPLTNGTSGEAPELALRTPDGADPLAFASFGNGPIGPGESRTIAADVSGTRLGRGTTIVLRVQNSDENDLLTMAARSGLRYDAVTLSAPERVDVAMTIPDVETPARGASRFAGLVVDRGAFEVRLNNELSFPIELDRLSVRNHAEAEPLLPESFPTLDVTMGTDPSAAVGAGRAHTWSADLADRGLARRVDVTVQGSPAGATDTITLRADGGLRVVGTSTPTIRAMHFWPSGETLRTEGRFSVGGGPVQFERDGDYVELASGMLRLRELTNELGVGFDSLAISVPGIRHRDATGDGRKYARGDSLAVTFVEHPDGPFEFEAIGPGASRTQAIEVGAVRLVPDRDALTYHVRATLNTVSETTAASLRTLRVQDELRSGLALERLDVRALRATVRPFTVNMTPDADGDGQLDLADDAEARTAAFPAFRGLTGQVDGLRPEGGRFTLAVETDLGTDMRLYGAVEGRHRGGTQLLGGKGPQRVAATDPAADAFRRGDTALGADDLLRFDVAEGPSDELVTRSVTLTENNADVDAFLDRLPTRLRFVGQSRIAGGRMHLRAPVQLDVGVGLRLPLSFAGGFSYRDTLGADLSGLSSLTDPDESVSVASAHLRVEYTNDLPVGFEAALVALDADGRRTMVLPGDEKVLTLEGAPKTTEGTAAAAQTGSLTLDLSAKKIRRLARAAQLDLRLRMDQRADGPAARVRADDTIQLSLSADVDASVRVGG